MRTQEMAASRITFETRFQLDDIPDGSPVEPFIGPGNPAPPRSIGARPCDGCGEPAPTVDLWAEHSETGEQLWLCTACGDC